MTKLGKTIATLLAMCALLITGCDDPNEGEGPNEEIQQEQNNDNGQDQENDDDDGDGGQQGDDD
jgi:hypothetical protein